MSLTDAQIVRYGRQILLPELGGVGQERLLQAVVSVSGTDRGAAEAARYLAAAGVGHVAVEEELREPLRAEVAARNPDVKVTGPVDDGYDVVVDGPDRAQGALAALRALSSVSG